MVAVNASQQDVLMDNASDDLLEFHADHRRQTVRQARHGTRVHLHTAVWDEEALEDVDAACPKERHDMGRHNSPKGPQDLKPGRRRGFKVWKTPFWKRRRTLWAEQNEATRRLSEAD
jgi:hypothetical protein